MIGNLFNREAKPQEAEIEGFAQKGNLLVEKARQHWESGRPRPH